MSKVKVLSCEKKTCYLCNGLYCINPQTVPKIRREEVLKSTLTYTGTMKLGMSVRACEAPSEWFN